MNVTVRDLVSKGYLVVGQQLWVIDGSKKRINLYVDSAFVSCEYKGVIIQCNTLKKLGQHLNVYRSMWVSTRTMDGVTMFDIRKRYEDDFMAKYNLTGMVFALNGVELEVAKEHYHDLDSLKKSIKKYHPALENFELVCSRD